QGIAVYGNKGSTDQHAYVQQLRDGVLNFFATFIEVHQDRAGDSPKVEADFTAGDFLQGFLLGTRDALFEKGRESITISVKDVTPHTVGMLIALYERAVGFYGTLVNVNAYHQPGVEAGKKAAASTLELRQKVVDGLAAKPGEAFTAEQLAADLGLESQTELIFKLLEHMAANNNRPIRKLAADPFYESKYVMEQ
ncbi:MAG: glucose-6-phosphate isomerase, partial [Puniceicoccales bacterium]